MNTKYYLFILLAGLLFSACNNSKDIDYKNLRGEMEINGEKIYMESGSYEIMNGKPHIDISGGGYAVSIKLKDRKSDKDYELSNPGNEIRIFDGSQFIRCNAGSVFLRYSMMDNYTGDFVFSYTDKSGKEKSVKGSFYHLKQLGEQQGQEVYSKHKFMFVDVDKGEIKAEETKCDVGYNYKTFILKIKEFPQYNIEIDIQQTDKTPSSIIFHPTDEKIKLITVDKMKDNQITILYKNGNSLVVL